MSCTPLQVCITGDSSAHDDESNMIQFTKRPTSRSFSDFDLLLRHAGNCHCYCFKSISIVCTLVISLHSDSPKCHFQATLGIHIICISFNKVTINDLGLFTT